MALNEEGRTQKEIGQLLGVSRDTVQVWLSSNVKNNNATKAPDCWVKITNDVKSAVLDQVSSGKTQQNVANTWVTHADQKKFQQAVPNCYIVH
jgi:predicted transcriptional regulator